MTSEYFASAAEAQLNATHPDQSVWVAASAGTGKTKVLTDRFLRLLLNGTRPQDVLCLTYTQAAAAEMIERLTLRLGQWAVMPEDALANDVGDLLFGSSPTSGRVQDGQARIATLLPRARSLFAAVLDCPGGLRIKTFHAFAQEILARFPVEAGLAPHFTLLDDSSAQALQEEALADMLQHSRHDATVAAAWELLAGRLDMQRLLALLRQSLHDRQRLQAVVENYGDVDAACTALFQQAGLTPGQSSDDLLRGACANAVLPLTLLQDWSAQLATEGKHEVATFLKFWLEASPAMRVEQWSDYKKLFLKDDENPRKNVASAATKKSQPQLIELLDAEQARILVLVDNLNKLWRVEATAAALRVGVALISAYTARKVARAVLDFDDVIDRAAILLAEPGIAPWVLWKLDGGLRHIMVDEAQDTSPRQWEIIAALTEEFFAGIGAATERRTLFVVGDPKQSIYSFQHADLDQFQEMQRHFTARAAAAGQKMANINLNVSFRSAPLVLGIVNKIFAHPDAQNGLDVSATQHQANETAAKGRMVLHPLLTPAAATVTTTWQPALAYEPADDPLRQLVTEIANTIKNWLGRRTVLVWEKDKNNKDRKIQVQRPCRPEDVMVLARRRGTLVPALVSALKQAGVPVAGVDRLVLRDALPVQDMLAAVQFALLPEDDLNLACVLRGPFVGLDDVRLEQLCSGRSGTLWQALCAAPDCTAINVWLTELQQRADQTGVYAFLARLLQVPCPAAASGKLALLRRLGLEALDPLDELLNRAQKFTEQQAPALQLFLQQMLKDESQIKRPLEQGAGEVRVMTVHGAKGLQAPIVIVADCASVPRAQDLPPLQWDEDSGLPCYTASGSRDTQAEALYQAAITAQRQEYRRLLYVALTRAESELHLFGHHGSKPHQLEESWHNLARQALAPDAPTGQGQPLFFVDEIGDTTVVPQRSADDLPLLVPDWITTPAPPEAPRRALHPSQLTVDESATSPIDANRSVAVQRGQWLHRLLHYLPEMPVARRAAAAQQFLRRQAGVDEVTAQAWAQEVLGITEHPAYAPLFAPGSRGEVPLGGTVLLDGALEELHGQLDRLALVGNEVWVVDFKTNRPPPDATTVPVAYQRQLEAYRALLQAVYPGKSVRCFLLWTQTARMQELVEPLALPLARRLKS